MGEFRNAGRKRSVIVVGAGPGGLAAAMLLAQRGFRVQLFEKQSVIVFGHIENPNGFFYLLWLSDEEAEQLGWDNTFVHSASW